MRPRDAKAGQGKGPGTGSGKRAGTKPAGRPAATHWENVADWYDKLVGDQGSEYHREVIVPGVLRMLELEAGQRVVDVACGQGVLVRAMAAKGVDVVGVDAAPGLIDAARERQKKEANRADFVVGDARELGAVAKLPVGSFDAATCVLAIQNITPLSPVWQGIYKLMKPGGRVVVVMMHPCFRIPKETAWGWDEAAHAQYRRVDSYLTSSKNEIQMKPGEVAAGGKGEATVTFHRPLQAYVNTMGNAGLWVDQIAEWASHKTNQPGPKKEALEKSRREIPMFLALRARAV